MKCLSKCHEMKCHGRNVFFKRLFRVAPNIKYIPVKSTDFGGSLPIFFTFFTFLPPTYRFTTIYQFLPIFSRIYRILIFSTDLFVISCKLCSHKCYFHVLMVKSVKNFLYLNFQATCNVLAQWVKCRWLVVAHFLPQGNFQMLTGMKIRTGRVKYMYHKYHFDTVLWVQFYSVIMNEIFPAALP